MTKSVVTPPRLCIVGPMVGRNPGHVTQQGEILADHLGGDGYEAASVSSATNRYLRFADIIFSLLRHRRHVDTVIIQTYGGPSFVVEDVASALAQALGHRIIFHLHGGAMPQFMARFPRWTRRVLNRADAIVAPSEFLARAVQRFGFTAHVIPNIIDLSTCAFRRRRCLRPRLFWMRSFHPLYNPLMALHVLAGVRSVLPDASLVMAGQDKGLEQHVRREAQRMGLADAVRFPGFLDAAGKRREGSAADIFINTNHVDNAPVALVEAWAMGLPVVSTDVGGVRDQLGQDGEGGLLVANDDAEAMAKAVLELIEDPDLAERLSRKGRQMAEGRGWQQIRGQWDRLFASLRGCDG